MIKINALGDICPIPVVKAKKAMDTMTDSDIIEVLVDNEIAAENVKKLALSKGAKTSYNLIEKDKYSVMISMGDVDFSKINSTNDTDTLGEDVIVISSNKMGEGAEELGLLLMKGYIFALTQLDVLPKEMIFYNSGALLTSAGSVVLEDLQALQNCGVEIVTCGMCLDYYDKKDKLAVGIITNMYDIAERFSKAKKIIKV